MGVDLADAQGIGRPVSLHRAVILLGPPGAGKGTQAKRIAERFSLSHLSTGDMFREEIEKDSELGRKAKPLVDRGELVPDDVVLEMVDKRIVQPDCANGFVFDGFPRTLKQAEGLEQISSRRQFGVSIVLFIVVEQDSLLRRLTGRRICKAAGHIYNVYSQPPKREGVCDIDGSELLHRADDTEAVICIRLAAYEKRTRPLIQYYSERGLLIKVDGVDDADVVTENVMKILNEAERPE